MTCLCSVMALPVFSFPRRTVRVSEGWNAYLNDINFSLYNRWFVMCGRWICSLWLHCPVSAALTFISSHRCIEELETDTRKQTNKQTEKHKKISYRANFFPYFFPIVKQETLSILPAKSYCEKPENSDDVEVDSCICHLLCKTFFFSTEVIVSHVILFSLFPLTATRR